LLNTFQPGGGAQLEAGNAEPPLRRAHLNRLSFRLSYTAHSDYAGSAFNSSFPRSNHRLSFKRLSFGLNYYWLNWKGLRFRRLKFGRGLDPHPPNFSGFLLRLLWWLRRNPLRFKLRNLRMSSCGFSRLSGFHLCFSWWRGH